MKAVLMLRSEHGVYIFIREDIISSLIKRKVFENGSLNKNIIDSYTLSLNSLTMSHVSITPNTCWPGLLDIAIEKYKSLNAINFCQIYPYLIQSNIGGVDERSDANLEYKIKNLIDILNKIVYKEYFLPLKALKNNYNLKLDI